MWVRKASHYLTTINICVKPVRLPLQINLTDVYKCRDRLLGPNVFSEDSLSGGRRAGVIQLESPFLSPPQNTVSSSSENKQQRSSGPSSGADTPSRYNNTLARIPSLGPCSVSNRWNGAVDYNYNSSVPRKNHTLLALLIGSSWKQRRG